MTLHGRKSLLRKKAKRGFRGYPMATVALYGPDDKVATKVAVAILEREGDEVSTLERWYSEEHDIRVDPAVEAAVVRVPARGDDRLSGRNLMSEMPLLGRSRQVDQGAHPVDGWAVEQGDDEARRALSD